MYWLTRKDGKKVRHGDVITSFRKEDWRFISLTQGNRKVYASKVADSSLKQEFIPGVFECEIKWHDD